MVRTKIASYTAGMAFVLGLMMAGAEVADPWWPWANFAGVGLVAAAGIVMTRISEG